MRLKGVIGWIVALAFACFANGTPHQPKTKSQAPESLTVRFFAKVYLLPTEDSPLIGMTGDGGRLAVYRHKGNWTQVGYKTGTGWIQIPDGPESQAKSESAPSIFSAGRWVELALPASAGICAFSLIAVVGVRIRRRRNRNRNRNDALHPAFSIPVAAESMTFSNPSCALEGKLGGNGLSEILQFLEVGRRSGMLSVEDGQPAGVINFANGEMTFSQTRNLQGTEAVLELLSLPSGTFHFFADKKVNQSNCKISAFEILLVWAHRMDESGKSALRF